MKRFFVSDNLIVGKTVEIVGTEHNHIKNVLRLNVGAEVILVCGDEYDYTASITDITKGKTTCFVSNKTKNENNSHCKVSVFQALVKSDNMSLIVQKLTELGVLDFYPFESTFITSKDKLGKTSKLQEISNQSIKQCKRSIPMRVHEALPFEKLLEKLSEFDKVIFANECEKSVNLSSINLKPSENIALIVGSEGGFSAEEIQKLVSAGAISITMGNRIMRAETASIALTAVTMYMLGEWS